MKKRNNIIIALFSSALISCPNAFAAAVSYDHIGLGYLSVDNKKSDIDPEGVEFHFSKSLSDSFYIKGQLAQLSGDDKQQVKTSSDTLTSELGVGYHVGIFKSVDLYSDVSFIYQSVKNKLYQTTSPVKSSSSDSGFAVELGAKMAFTHTINADLFVKRWEYEAAGQTEFGTHIRYAFEHVDLVATVSSGKNQQTVGFGFQYKF